MNTSKQAFSKARANLNPEYIRTYPDKIGEYFAGDEDRLLYKGMTVIAIDGSDIALTNSKALLEHFGGAGPHKDAPTALASLAYDPLNQAIYDFQLDTLCNRRKRISKTSHASIAGIGVGAFAADF